MPDRDQQSDVTPSTDSPSPLDVELVESSSDTETSNSKGTEPLSAGSEQTAESDGENGSAVSSEAVEVSITVTEKVELTEEQVKELLSQLADDTPGPAAPTETYTHPVTGREVYVPKSQKIPGPTAAISTMALLMFVGGGLATLMMVARAFDLHGDVLVSFVIGSCALVLGMAGGLLLKTLGDKWWIGAIVGACFGVIGGILIYAQTSHHAWWH